MPLRPTEGDEISPHDPRIDLWVLQKDTQNGNLQIKLIKIETSSLCYTRVSNVS